MTSHPSWPLPPVPSWKAAPAARPFHQEGCDMSDHPSLNEILAGQRAEKERLADEQKLAAEKESRRQELLDLFLSVRYCNEGFLRRGADFYAEFACRLATLAIRLSERGELESLLARLRDVPADADSTERDARLLVVHLLTLGKDGQVERVAQALRETTNLSPLFQYRVNDWLRRRVGDSVFAPEPAPASDKIDPAAIPSAPLVIDGCQVLRDATPEELNDAPPPDCGRFVVVWEPRSESERIALLWEDADGTPTLETGTDGLTVLGIPARATWLPEGWRMQHFPTGLALPNLEPWFRCIIGHAEDDTFAVGPGYGEPSCPTVRGMVAHAYMIVRHYDFPDSPKEPQQLLDREGYVTNLREVLHFLRRHLAGGRRQQTGPTRLGAAPPSDYYGLACDLLGADELPEAPLPILTVHNVDDPLPRNIGDLTDRDDQRLAALLGIQPTEWAALNEEQRIGRMLAADALAEALAPSRVPAALEVPPAAPTADAGTIPAPAPRVWAEPLADGTVKDSRIWLKGKPYRLTLGLRGLLNYLLANPNVSEEQVIKEFGMSGSSHLHKRLKDLRNKLAKELKKCGWRLHIKTEYTRISCKWEETM
jgi:hypothetical protein